MARIYANLCMKGKKKFSDVPNHLKEKVRKILITEGYTYLVK